LTWQWLSSEHFYESPPNMPKDFATCVTSALTHVFPRTGPISPTRLNRTMVAIYKSCSGSRNRL